MADDKWESAFGVLSKVSPNDLGNICHLVAESICRDGVISPEKFLATWSLEEWWQIKSTLTDIMKTAVGKGWTKEEIATALGSLDASFKKVICDAVTVHEDALRKKMLQETTAVSHAVLDDFDWKLKLAMSSDKLALLQEPLLQLDFYVRQASGERKQVYLELDKAELSKLISSLEGCSKSVQQLSTSS